MKSKATVPHWQCRLLVVLTFLSCVASVAQDIPVGTLPSTGGASMPAPVLKLWQGMLNAGMIDDEQYQYVLQHGRLAPGSVVQNSPVTTGRQVLWQNLATHNVITTAELASMLFAGAIPDLSEIETKAFEDLAPLYEPDPRRRLTYDIRRKHQRVDLIRLKHRSSAAWRQSHEAAVLWARQSNEPVRVVTDTGTIWELDSIDSDGSPVYLTTCNINAARTISADKVRSGGSAPFHLTGTNITVAMWDGGIAVTNHQEFGGRVRNCEQTSVVDHPTGVAGTLVANGTITSAQGMARQGHVDVYYWDDYIADMSDCVAANPDIQVSNHSWSRVAGWDNSTWYYPRWHGDAALSETEDFNFGRYHQLAREMDDFCVAAPYHLPVRSCGNDRGEIGHVPLLQTFGYGYHDTRLGGPNDWFTANSGVLPRPADGGTNGFDCIQPHGVAKNILTVGSVGDLPNGYTNGAAVLLATYSGCGPVDDGRIKPDVVANGEGVYTTFTTTTNGYASKSGTSFSSPSAAGSIALLQELHERLYGTNQPMLASTLKALVIHTADDIGSTPGPDYRFGWGLLNVERAAWCITNNASWNSLPHIKGPTGFSV